MRTSRCVVTLLVALSPLLARAEINTVGKVSARAEGAKTVITVQGTATPSFTAYRLEKPSRVVVDLADGKLAAANDGPIDVDTWAVGQIALAQYQNASTRTARVMIGFKRASTYDVRAQGSNVIITITPNEAPPADQVKQETAKAEDAKRRAEMAEASAKESEARQKGAESALREAERKREEVSMTVEAQKKQAQTIAAAKSEAERTLKDLETQRARAEKARVEEEKRLAAVRDARAEEERRVAKQMEGRRAEMEALTRAETMRHEAEAARARAEAAKVELDRLIAAKKATLAQTVATPAPAVDPNATKALEAARVEAERLAKQRTQEAQRVADLQLQARKMAEQRAAKMNDARRAAEERQQAQEAARLAEEKRLAAVAATESERARLAELKIESAKAADAAKAARVDAEKARVEMDRLIVAQRQERAKVEEARVAAKFLAEQRSAEVERARNAQVIASGSTAKIEQAERDARRIAEERQKESARLQQIGREAEALAQKRADEQKRLELARTEAKQLVEKRDADLKALRDARAKEESKLTSTRDEIARLNDDLKKLEEMKAQAQKAAERGMKERERRESEERELAARVETQKKELERLSKAMATRDAQSSPKMSTASMATGNKTRVRDIRVSDDADAHRLIVDLSGDADYQVIKSDSRSAVLRLTGADLPKKLERTLDASAYNGPIKSVSTYPDPTQPGTVRVEVALATDAQGGKPRLVRDNGQLTWEFPRAQTTSMPTQKLGGYATPSIPLQVAQNDSMRMTQSMGSAANMNRRNKKSYTGRRIDLDFKDADIHNILRLLQEVGQVNIVASDDVKGQITIRMKDVPWDQALDVILRSKQLGMQREGNLLRVAPAATLEKELEQEIARMKQAVELKPLDTRLVPLSYAEAKNIMPRIKDVLSPRGTVSVDERTNMLIVSDVAGNIALAEDLVRNLDTQTPQVLIEARIVEARSTFTRTIGIQWGGNSLNSTATGNPTGIVFPSTVGVGGGATDGTTNSNGVQLPAGASPNYVVNMPAPVGTGSGGALGLTLGSVTGALNINLRLSSLENTGQVRIVSAPKIMTLDNVEATIEQGVAIPISVVSAAGTNTMFVDAKLNLTVKPHVTNEGSVVMAVKIMRNEPDFVNVGARGDPTILKRQANTEMLVRDGDTAVIGGIYSRNSGISYNKVPWFAEIPVLGWLFKNRRENDDRTELLIFITPRIVNRSGIVAR